MARQVKIAQPTVTMVLKRFAKYGYDVDRLMRGEKATGRPIKPIGSKAIEQELLSQSCLEDWTHLNLHKRCERIWKVHKVRVKRDKLRLFYLRHGITCKATSTKYYPHNKNLVQLQEERVAFARQLVDWIREDKPIVYFDESSFNANMIQKRAWYFRDVKFVIPACQYRLSLIHI